MGNEGTALQVAAVLGACVLGAILAGMALAFWAGWHLRGRWEEHLHPERVPEDPEDAYERGRKEGEAAGFRRGLLAVPDDDEDAPLDAGLRIRTWLEKH